MLMFRRAASLAAVQGSCSTRLPRLYARLSTTNISGAGRTPSATLTNSQEVSQAAINPGQLQLDKQVRQRDAIAKAEALLADGLDPAVIDRWELAVGIEIHAQLNTEHKLFSNARSAPEEEANTLAAVFDLALPGSQPIFQPPVLVPALRAAHAFNCDVRQQSKFDRKHYFYHDQPQGYQITQYYQPFAVNGNIVLHPHDGIAPEEAGSLVIGIKQIQLEQDTAKTVQQPPDTVLLDFNRVGHPLIEIIGLPQIHHPKTASAYVRKVSQTLMSVNAVTTGLELGGLRADVNVSVRRKGQVGEASYAGVKGLGQRTEIKNLSSFKAVEDAINAERNRQIAILECGGSVEGETRGWTLGSNETVKLRGKEGEVDYRYMPDPDIPPLLISPKLSKHIRKTLPVLPDEQLESLTSTYGLSQADGKALVVDGARVEFFRSVVDALQQSCNLSEKDAGKLSGNWVLHELGSLLSTSQQEFSESSVNAIQLASILGHLHSRSISGKTAKRLLAMLFDGDTRPVAQIISDEGLALQQLSSNEYQQMAASLAEDHAELAEKVRQGQIGKVQFFVGQMMRRSRGTMDAEKARDAVESILGVGQKEQ